MVCRESQLVHLALSLAPLSFRTLAWVSKGGLGTTAARSPLHPAVALRPSLLTPPDINHAMALKDLTTPQMLTITAAWVDPKRERPKLEGLKRIAPLLADIDSAHMGLGRARRTEKTTSKEMAEIQSQQLALDKIHDRKARGAHAILTGFADLADDPEDATHYLNIREELFPDGLKFITSSYSDEAGQAHIVRERLTAESRGALKALPTPSGSMLKAVLAWLSAGQELGKLEIRKAQLAAAERPIEGTVQGNHLKARNRWIKVVSSVISMLELEEEINADTQRLILAPLHEALAKAERRRGGATEEAETAEEPQEGGAAAVESEHANREEGTSGPG